MFKWLLLLIAYLPFQIALNPRPAFDLASLRVFIVLLFIIWLGKALTTKKLIGWTCFKNLQSIGLFLFFILAGFSLIGAENIIWGLRKLIFFLSVFPLYFLVTALIDNWLKIKKIIFALTGGAGLIALIGLGQFIAPFIFGLDKICQFWAWQIVPVFSGFNFGALILAYSSWLVNVDGYTILRAFSLFSDPHMFSFYLGLILPLIVVLIYVSDAVRSRQVPDSKTGFLFIIYCLLFTVLLLTFTRGAYFAIIVTFLVLAGLFWRYLKAKKIALLLGLSLLVFIIPITPIADRFYSSFDMSDGSNVGRLEMWQQAGLAGLERPWQGVGLGNYSLLVDANFGYRNPITAHNLYLDIFSEIGIFALIVWLVLILGTMGQLFWQIRITPEVDLNKGQTIIRIGLIGSLVYFSVHSFFETSIYHPSILALLMIILGLSSIVVNFKDCP